LTLLRFLAHHPANAVSYDTTGMDRRDFLSTLGLGVLAAPLAEAQQAGKVWRIGFLAGGSPPVNPAIKGPFQQGLEDLGYIVGRNVSIESRYADGKLDRLSFLAAELVALKVDVIVTGGGTLGALAAKNATRTVPIVFIGVGDPVASGVVTSLARPGGNITGLSTLAQELVGKCLEQLKQAVPRVRRVAVLWQPGEVGEFAEEDRLQRAEVAAQMLAIQLQFLAARSAADLDKAFSDMARSHVDALTALSSTVLFLERRRVADLAVRNRLPTVFSVKEYVEAGGLMSYGPNFEDLFRQGATYVDKILKGAKPADLPVEQTTKFELVINLKTAKALGLTIPQSLLLRADAVIQ
jgi:putative ABC transport system substrate-binding protein